MYREGQSIIQGKILTDFNLPLCIAKCQENANFAESRANINAFNK